VEVDIVAAAGTLGVGTAIARVFGPALTEYGGSLGDRVKEWRFRNLAAILERVQGIADQRKLSPENLKALPFGDALRVVEAASGEEDPAVQELWARLLANASDPDGSGAVAKVHVDILKAISAPEATFLQLMCDYPARIGMNRPDIRRWEDAFIELAEVSWRKFPDETRATALANLKRLECVTFRPENLDADALLTSLPVSNPRSDYTIGIDSQKLVSFMEHVLDMIGATAGAHEYRERLERFRRDSERLPEQYYMLTGLGRSLMDACKQPAGVSARI